MGEDRREYTLKVGSSAIQGNPVIRSEVRRHGSRLIFDSKSQASEWVERVNNYGEEEFIIEYDPALGSFSPDGRLVKKPDTGKRFL